MRRRWIKTTGLVALVGAGLLLGLALIGDIWTVVADLAQQDFVPAAAVGIVAPLLAIGAGLYFWKRLAPQKNYRVGRCARCGYPLVNVPRRQMRVGSLSFDRLVCPECGEADEESEVTRVEGE